ncbi:uncharacterized protein LOC113230561 isoform X4 [Hyposmocoma kahamanoa]|uniref:uncharacterized protein LOC113230561 isoform X4 n=1 Tax=Hyposmocoma kahamanoa TaxID=1477025 RepID=UPI000E6DA0E8|nr:uncharacterized protein LOC113230561 isoform X4 [Hyposmocoma kahamanoa]
MIKHINKGSHPDSLYRVPNDSDADASKLSRMFRTLRWPVALIVICVALAVFVYFLMPDHMNTELELVNSTFWNTNPNVPPKEKLQDTSDRSVGLQTTSTNVLSTTQPTKKPGAKTPEIDFNDAETGKNMQLISIIESITDRKPMKKIPVVPVFPTRITPEVQYGNENADTNKLRSPKLLEKIIVPAHDSTVKPHITLKPEKPLSVYFKRVSTSTIRSTNASTTSPSTETITITETTSDYSVDNREDEIPIYYASQPPRRHTPEEPRYPADEDPESDYTADILPYNNSPAKNVEFNFTSGHSKFFGIGIEDAEKMKSTTQSSLYNTRVSPTLPTWRDGDDTTTKKYPINTNADVPQCHSPRQAMCRGVLPYDLAGPAPTLDGKPIAKMLPQMEYLLATNCSIRARQFLCSLLEPECNPPPFPPKMPCFSLCKAVMDYCDEFIPRELVNAFKCNQYPSINCISARSPCGRRELQCRDGTCVPRDWMCDGNRDCSTGDDEEPCITCEKGQYKCPTSGACVKKEWICDGYNDCPDGDDEDSILCKQTNSQRNPTAAASEEHEGEEAVGSAPAPSVRRPNHLPTARTRSQFRGDDSKELLITSDSNNGFRRNFTRRPSPSRLTPYRPKHREPPIRDDNNESEEQVAKSHKKRPDAKLDDKIYSDDNINIEDLGLFEEFTKDNKEQRKQYREREKASLMGGAPYPSGYSDPAPKKTHSTQKPKAQTEIIDDDGIPPPKTTKLDKSNKYERIIDGAALLRKAAEEAKRAAEISTEPFRMAYDDFPAISTSGGRSHSSPCPSGELRCVDGRCINLAQLCDGTIDCSDHADEDNCYT